MSETLLEMGPPAARAERSGFEPVVVAIVCNWCTYAGADMAGTTRRAYAPNVRLLRVPCTGRVSPLQVLKAFEQGADGVLVSGCHPGDCHYVHGNLLARRRLAVLRALLDFVGLDARRFHVSWVSASEGVRWARVVEAVTDAVRDAGPLEAWSPREGEEPVELPEPPPAPHPAPSPEAQEAVGRNLRSLAASLLGEGRVATFLGYGEAALPGRAVPLFASDLAEASALVWNDQCFSNLAVYLAGPNRIPGKVAVVLKACDARAVTGLLQEGQLRREDLVLVGVRCPGVRDENGRLALKCHACDGEVAAGCDFTVSAEGAETGAVRSAAPREPAPDPRDAQIAFLEGLPPARRWAFWREQFDRCLRCYACRAVCPLCYCGTCISEQHRPQWIPASIGPRGNAVWNAVRAYHLAGRCAGCDECARACPARLRLDLLNRRLALEVERRFGYRAGEDPGAAPPLAAFRPEDPQEFVHA